MAANPSPVLEGDGFSSPRGDVFVSCDEAFSVEAMLSEVETPQPVQAIKKHPHPIRNNAAHAK
jgi:hypothetical protein